MTSSAILHLSIYISLKLFMVVVISVPLIDRDVTYEVSFGSLAGLREDTDDATPLVNSVSHPWLPLATLSMTRETHDVIILARGWIDPRTAADDYCRYKTRELSAGDSWRWRNCHDDDTVMLTLPRGRWVCLVACGIWRTVFQCVPVLWKRAEVQRSFAVPIERL